MTYLSYTFLKVVQRLASAPQHQLARASAPFSRRARPEPASGPAPDHVITRLESMFEALSELPLQPHVAAALDLACDMLQAELPVEALAAGLYDIDSDEVHIVAARGLEHDLLQGTVMPRGRCFVGYAAEQAIITRGDVGGASWLGGRGEGSSVLLCPILHDAHLLGVIALADPLCASEFSHHDVELVAYVAEQLATFIHAHRHRPQGAVSAVAQRG